MKTLTKEHKKYLEGRGITEETATRFGLFSDAGSIGIPVRGNTRVYTPNGNPKIRWAAPMAEGDIAPPFPSEEDFGQAELIVEGEFDCLLAIQNGFKAVTGTAGAGTFHYEWADMLRGPVTILYDNDEPGSRGSRVAAKLLQSRGISVSIAKWPRGTAKGYDITDFFTSGGTGDGLRRIIDEAKPYDSDDDELAPSAFGEIYADLDDDPIVPTGFNNIDSILRGLRKKELTVLAARTKVGKSTLATQIALNIAKTGKTAIIFSLEMSEQQILERIIAAESGVDKGRIEDGLFDSDIRELYRHIPRIWGLPLRIDSRQGLSAKQIYTGVKQISKSGPLGVVVVDYTNLVATTERGELRTRQLTGVLEDLRNMGKEFDVPVIALAQIGRSAQYQGGDWGDEPDLHHLSESGGFEITADTVIILWRDRKEEKDAIEKNLDMPTHGKVAKNRNGRESYFNLKLDGPRCMFWEDVV